MATYNLYTLVGAFIFFYCLQYAFRKYQNYRADADFGARHGCQLPPNIINEWPFGVDRLEQIFRANRELRLMELFLFHFRQTGNTLQQVFLGTEAYGTIDPENLEAVLSTNFQDYGMGPRRAITYPLFGDGIFTQEGPDWKKSRDLLRPQFNHKQYANLEVFHEHVDTLIDCIRREGPVVDLLPLFFRLTLDTTTAFLFGESVNSLGDAKTADEKSFADNFNTAQEYVAKRFRLLDMYMLIGGKHFRDCCDAVHHFADRILDRTLNQKNGSGEGRQARYVFLDVVAERLRDRTALRHQMINILAAGRDTTACLLGWTFWLLVRHTPVMDKLRTEIKEIVGDKREITRADLKEMKFLNNVLKETLRLYPSLPVNNRTALKTTILPMGGGPDRQSPVLIRKGTTIAYSVYSMHRRSDLYGEDAEEFRPERWDGEMGLNRNETTKSWGYLPFNGGPRICLGMDFALTEAAYTVVSIIQEFPNIKKPDNEISQKLGMEKQTMTLVIAPGDGCNIDISSE